MSGETDQNGGHAACAADVIIRSLKDHGGRIHRAQFLYDMLYEKYPEDVIDTAVAETPAKAGIPGEEIYKTADEVMNRERDLVLWCSLPSGMPADAMMWMDHAAIAQYNWCTMRAAQKLLYLYGFPDIDPRRNDPDPVTIGILTLCLGIMYGSGWPSDGRRLRDLCCTC